MSELSEKFEAALQPVKTGFAEWFDSQPKADQETYLRYAPIRELSHRAFFDIVTERGARSSRETVTDWRKAHGFGRP